MGRIDVHSHLLPAVDDGCSTLEESLGCARLLADAGYSHCFCTPHIWWGYKDIVRQNIPTYTQQLQAALDNAGIPLRLLPGSELNLHANLTQTPLERIIDLGLAGKHILVDMWADKLPDFFELSIRWLQAMNLTVILGHPERMRAVQDQPELADRFAEMGILLQGNLQCFADRPDSYTRRTAERLITEGRYFCLGSDAHNVAGMKTRLIGLKNAIDLVGEKAVDQLTRENPQLLLSPAA